MNPTTYIAAGSNSGNRLDNLMSAFYALKEKGYKITGVSAIYETPAALLYETAEDTWNKPYLNCLFKIETRNNAFALLDDLKNIEKKLGRNQQKRWSPRVIDLDIIEHNDEQINTERLCIPHKQCLKRSFVLDPLSFFKTLPCHLLYTKTHQPLIMGILNVTPDSFSDGGENISISSVEKKISFWDSHLIPLIDIGAQSTRPQAVPIDADEEGKRLKDVFDYIKHRKKTPFSPRFSIDTYHIETAEKALKNGFDVLNDVHGLDDPDMFALAAEHKEKFFIFMHHDDISSLALKDTLHTIEAWLEKKIELFEKNNFYLPHMIFDPGIGFGKSACQSLQILQNLESFHRFGVKIAIGHSRKSFMSIFTTKNPKQKDIETLAISTKIADKVDLLRVHTPVEHKEALLASAHMENQFF